MSDFDYEHEGRVIAREYALWHLGSPIWADRIIHAYLNPADALAELEKEKAE